MHGLNKALARNRIPERTNECRKRSVLPVRRQSNSSRGRALDISVALQLQHCVPRVVHLYVDENNSAQYAGRLVSNLASLARTAPTADFQAHGASVDVYHAQRSSPSGAISRSCRAIQSIYIKVSQLYSRCLCCINSLVLRLRPFTPSRGHTSQPSSGELQIPKLFACKCSSGLISALPRTPSLILSAICELPMSLLERNRKNLVVCAG